MMSARVIEGFGRSSGYVAYTMERAGPPPSVTQCSHALVAAVHGVPAASDAAAGLHDTITDVRAATVAKRKSVRMRTHGLSEGMSWWESFAATMVSRGTRPPPAADVAGVNPLDAVPDPGYFSM